MANTGSVKSDQLFKGLTRTAMLFGVSYSFAILNFMVCIMTFMYSNDFRVLFLLGPAVHGIGFLASSKEPLFIELFMVKMQKCSKCVNRFYHGSNSYDIV